MKYVREHINEKFTDESDPIHDMGIGLLKKLRTEYVAHYSWHKLNPEDVSVNQLMSFCLGKKKYDISIIEALIDAGADIKSSHDLFYSVYRGIDFVKLLDRGADPKTRRCSTFVHAVDSNKLDIADLLLKYGANVHANGDEALRNRAHSNDTETIKWLLERGANPNARRYYPLQQALKNGNYELADILTKEYLKDRKK